MMAVICIAEKSVLGHAFACRKFSLHPEISFFFPLVAGLSKSSVQKIRVLHVSQRPRTVFMY